MNRFHGEYSDGKGTRLHLALDGRQFHGKMWRNGVEVPVWGTQEAEEMQGVALMPRYQIDAFSLRRDGDALVLQFAGCLTATRLLPSAFDDDMPERAAG
ncbi:MAG: hypothetical protein KC620_02955 [Myxococcales bacterium]|nr:hypothetical protein [Myxococcales bacterium]